MFSLSLVYHPAAESAAFTSLGWEMSQLLKQALGETEVTSCSREAPRAGSVSWAPSAVLLEGMLPSGGERVTDRWPTVWVSWVPAGGLVGLSFSAR